MVYLSLLINCYLLFMLHWTLCSLPFFQLGTCVSSFPSELSFQCCCTNMDWNDWRYSFISIGCFFLKKSKFNLTTFFFYFNILIVTTRTVRSHKACPKECFLVILSSDCGFASLPLTTIKMHSESLYYNFNKTYITHVFNFQCGLC